ncbi:hypothetical protein AB0C52_02560 [Streptomyces sp. NPDC048717]|uniref:hypothetical protein n=1 Tax=Streptomyces sp. NPDC048717 TaxID=3154928 RepID=UPI0034454117
MTRRRENYLFEDDFGLSALAGEMAASSEPIDENDMFRLAASVAADGDGEGAVELGRDLDCLLRAGLSDDVLGTLWQAATGDDRLPAAIGADARDLLSRLAMSYPAPSGTGAPAPEPDTTSRADVIAEVRASAADPAGGAALSAALMVIVDHADEDLGLRLLIRFLKTRRVLVAKERYDRLTALGRRFDYSGPLVYDGLSVAWPPIDPARRDGEGDFGLSDLTWWFSWKWMEPTARDRLRVAVAADEEAHTPGSGAALVLVDVLRLLDSPLSDDTLATLWREATRRAYDPGRIGIGARDWLKTIADECRARLAEVAPDYRPVTPPVDEEYQDAVLREVRESAAVTGDGPAAALEEVVTRVDPELGYRLLLRMLAARTTPLGEEEYERHVALCRHFRFGAAYEAEAVELLRHR